MAKKCPSVHSFEPQPELAAKLRTWLPSNVTLHEVGVGLSTGTATLTRPDHNVGTDGLATLRPDPSDIRGETIQVDVVSIDDCDLHDVGFIKVDVEGLELDALRGAEKTIRRDQPRLMVEIEQRHLDYPMTDVFDWLTEHGYQGWFLRAGEQQRAYSWVPLDDFDIDHDQTQQLGQLKSAQYINAFLFVSKDDAWNPPSARRG